LHRVRIAVRPARRKGQCTTAVRRQFHPFTGSPVHRFLPYLLAT
jgi:hypothetical protein